MGTCAIIDKAGRAMTALHCIEAAKPGEKLWVAGPQPYRVEVGTKDPKLDLAILWPVGLNRADDAGAEDTLTWCGAWWCHVYGAPCTVTCGCPLLA